MSRVRSLWFARLLFALLSCGIVAPQVEASAQRTTRSATKSFKKKPAPRYSARAARARRARLARARAIAQRRQIRELQQPHFRLDSTGSLVPDVRAAAAIIYHPETGQVLWEENSQDSRSIASITKVMTAVVFLENIPDLSHEVIIDRSDVYAASTTYLRANETLTVDDLLHLLLIASDNAAARALARVSEHGGAGFVRRMNEKAIELGLEHTRYTDSSGLDAGNISSAYDMARLIAFASGDERIAAIMRTPEYTIRTTRRVIRVNSTNQLVRSGEVDVRAGKTGFINNAGYCLATLLRLPQGGQQVAVVVLGANSNAGRFMETRHLVNWITGKAQELFSPKEQ